MALPSLNSDGDLRPGIHLCSLDELLARFGTSTQKRRLIGLRLQRVLNLVTGSEQIARVIVFGSFLSSTPDPNDIDLFLVMEDTFDLGVLAGEARLVFEHSSA